MAGLVVQSISNPASTTGPAANAQVAGFTGGSVLLANTTYEITAGLFLSGTAPVDGTDSDNVYLFLNGTSTSHLPHPATAGVLFQWKVVVTTDGGGTVALLAVRNATAGTIYHGSLIATPLQGQFYSTEVI